MNRELIQFINTFPAPVRIVDVDRNGIPTYCAFNEAALLDDDLDHQDIEGRSAADVYPGVLGQIARNRQLTVVQTKRPLTFDIDEDLPDGRRWIRITLAPAIDKDGLVQKIFCTQVDVTAEKMMPFIESDAEARMREMEQYLAMAAHDLRSPMVNVRLIADYIQEDFKDLGDGKLQMLTKLKDIADKSMRLISDVLAHSLANMVTEPKTDIFKLDELCTDIIAILDPFNRSTLSCQSLTLASDKVAVQVAIRNLMDNALKHNPHSGLSLSVSACQINTHFLQFCITDDGKGFGDATIKFLHTSELTSESGYGLLGVRRLVRARGGDIKLKTEDNRQGVAITFTLPGTLIEQHERAA